MFSTQKRCLIGLPIWGYQKFYSLPPKNWIFGPKTAKFCPKWAFLAKYGNMGIIGPFDLMPDQKTMRTSCLAGFLLCWYQNFYCLPPKNWIFGPKTAKFGPKTAFLANLIPCRPNNCFSVTWVPKFLLPLKRIRIFGPKKAKFGPKSAKYCHFLPDQKTMWTRCLGGFSVMWVTKLLFPPIRVRIFGPKKAKFTPNMHFGHFGSNLGLFIHLVQCPTIEIMRTKC